MLKALVRELFRSGPPELRAGRSSGLRSRTARFLLKRGFSKTALVIASGDPAVAASRAEGLRRGGDPRAALEALPPGHAFESDADAMAARGLALRDLGQTQAAIVALESALRLRPDDAELLNELGVLELAQKNLDKAQELFERASRIAPRLHQALANLGVVHLQRYNPERAIPYLERAVRAAPDDPSNWLNLAAAMRDVGDYDGAERALQDGQLRSPENPKFEFRRATLDRERGLTAMAQTRLERVLSNDPSDFAARQLLGMVLQDRREYPAARACFDFILERIPQHPQARFARGLLSLLQGEFRGGWDDYEARFLTEESPRRGFAFREWDGQPIEGRLLVYAEQGVGDEIMFASCIPDAMARSGHCIVECEPRLAPLFARSFPGATVIGAARGDSRWLGDVASVEAQAAIGSLPSWFRRGASSFEDRAPYLRADPERVAYWKARLRELSPGPYIGLSWRGGIGKTRRLVRSVPLEAWRPLLQATAATWVCLQYDVRDGESDVIGAIAGSPLWTWPQTLADLDDTAALICALDQVVSVCTALVHLSGALGQRATVLVPSAPEWRYGAFGERMTWYSSVSLVRQQPDLGWDAAVALAIERMKAPA